MLDFSEYSMVECPEPTLFVVTSDPEEQAEQEAFSDMEHADCIKRHNGLVGEIKTIIQLLE